MVGAEIGKYVWFDGAGFDPWMKTVLYPSPLSIVSAVWTLLEYLSRPSNVQLVMFVTPSPLYGPGLSGAMNPGGTKEPSFSLSISVVPFTCKPTESKVIKPLLSAITFRLPWINVLLMIVVCVE